MKASVLCENESLRYLDVEEKKVGNDDVKVKVRYTGICGSDLPRVFKNGARYYPIILGHEFSGEIVEVGENVKSVIEGDHVVGIPLIPCFECDDCKKGDYSLCKHYDFVGSRRDGSYAEYVVLPEKCVFKISKSIPFEKAAFFEPITVAYHGLKQAKYESGKTVAILGNGTIGLFTSQLVKALGASKVVMYGRNKNKFELAQKLGADNCICTLDDDFIKQSMDLTEGRGFDFVFVTAAATETFKSAFELAGNKSTVCLIGTPTENLTFTPRLWELLNRKEFYLTGSWMSYSSPFPGEEWIETNRLLAENKIDIADEMIYKIVDLENAMDAFNLFKENKVSGKVLIKCNKD